MKIMAIDYGASRVGIALTDPLGIIAQPYMSLQVSSRKELYKRLKFIIKENGVGLVLIGNPLSHQGAPTEFAKEVSAFASELARSTGLEIKLRDERFTSRYAETRMREFGFSRKQRSEKIDQVAAAIILEEYLQSCPGTA